MNLQNLDRIDKEVLKFVFETGEASYTDLKTYVENNGICSEKTLVTHKKQLEAGDILKKKLSKKTGRPAYFIPTNVRGNFQQLLDKEEAKRDCAVMIDNATPEEIQELRKNFRELKKLVYPLYAKLEAELFRIKYEAGQWRGMLAMLEKRRWKPLSIFWKGELQKLSGATETQVAELEPQVAQLRRFFDSEEAQRARNQVLLEEIRQLARDRKGEKWRRAVYANWLAEWEAQEKREQERG